MGIHSEMLSDRLDNFVFNEQFHQETKELDSEEKNGGTRGDLNRFAKSIDEMAWFAKPKNFYSAKRQLKHLFNWMQDMTDFRTRRIVIANFYSYLAKLTQDELSQLTEETRQDIEYIKEKHMFIYGEDIEDVMMKISYEMATIAGQDVYKTLVEENDDKATAEYFKSIAKEKELSFEAKRRIAMAHRAFTFARAMKYVDKDYKNLEDIYVNTSLVYIVKKERQVRRTQNRVTEICTLFCELDYYKIEEYKDKTQNEMIELVFEALDQANFVRPTMIVKSRGLHIYWAISPLAYSRFRDWELMQKKVHEILEKFGADARTTCDKVRLLRLVGSIHSTTKKRVTAVEYTSDRYNFDELKELYIKAECENDDKKRIQTRKKTSTAAKKKQVFKVLTGGGKQADEKEITIGHQISHAIYKDYLNDVFILVDLRNGEMEGNREFCCFLVRYWTLCLTNNPLKAIQAMEKMYYSLNAKEKYTFSEIVDLTRSAEKQHKLWLENYSKGYNYGNERLLELLEITAEEERHLTKIMSKSEVKRRKDKRNKEYYERNEKKKHNKTELLRQRIIEVINENQGLGAVKISNLVKEKYNCTCSKNTVLKVKKEMENS